MKKYWKCLLAAKEERSISLDGFDLESVPRELYDPAAGVGECDDGDSEDLFDHRFTYASALESIDLGRIRYLNLARNKLKELPQELGRFVHLEVLLLEDNALALLPSSIAGLTKLQRLSLQGNSELQDPPQVIIKSGEDAVVNYLRSLHDARTSLILSLCGQALPSVPLILRSLPNLRELSLVDNAIRELPEWISVLEDLQILDVHGNQLTHVSRSQ